uniref:Uncharacterized protein n=1 Tax=Rhizophora mucronata TaxID=61149 RepID=A0A2P2M9W5_RHIMU
MFIGTVADVRKKKKNLMRQLASCRVAVTENAF